MRQKDKKKKGSLGGIIKDALGNHKRQRKGAVVKQYDIRWKKNDT